MCIETAVAGWIADADAPLLAAGLVVDRADVAAGVDRAVNQTRFDQLLLDLAGREALGDSADV